MRKNRPPKENYIGMTIPAFPTYVIAEHVASGANGHLFRAYSEVEKNSLAFKFVPIDNLETKDKDQYLQEAQRPNILSSSPVVKHIRVVDCTVEGPNIPYIIFVCEYVNGKSLEQYLQDDESKKDVDLAFIRAFLESMLRLLHELQLRGFDHGDLHPGNVLVAKSPFDIDGRVEFKVTDFGVRHFADASQRANDFHNVAATLRRLLNLVDFRESSGLDRFVLTALRDRFLNRYLLEDDPTADRFARNPSAIFHALRDLDNEYRAAQLVGLKRSLATPFDYPNCEQIGDSHLMLRALYSNRLLELTKIEAHTNIVLTGPRGCGKTTVFRALSLEYLTATEQDGPEKVNYIGIYYRCDDLYFAFPRYQDLPREDAIDIPMHFIIVTLLSLLLRDLDHWARRHYPDEWMSRLGGVVEKIWATFEWHPPSGPHAHDLSTLDRRLTNERRRAQKTHRFARRPDHNIEGFFGPGVMIEVCDLLRESFPFLQTRSFHFYIDDYSWPKISKALQSNLNRLLMLRTPSAFFKLSTESPVSFVRNDLDEKMFGEAREFDFINLGVRYITDKTGQTADFVRDLFRRRFEAVSQYPVKNLKELLGSCPRNENARARVLRGVASEKENAMYRYLYGEEVISSMCSGDVHHMIRLVSRMVDDYGGVDALAERVSEPGWTVGAIPPEMQQQSIRNEAGAIMDSIRTVPGVGQGLADVVAAFGNVAQSYLRHKDSKNEKGSPPHQATKIEPYEALDLGSEANHILEELLRYSVFIADPKGKSRRGKVVLRLYLRRSLIPHFGLTFSQRDSIELGNVDVELLFLNPGKFEDKHRIRKSRGSGGALTEDMFDEWE